MERMRLGTLFITVLFIVIASLGTSSIVGYHEQVCEQGEKLTFGFTIKNDHPFLMNDAMIKLNITSCDGKPVSSMERMPYFLFSGSTIMRKNVGKIDEFRRFSSDIQTYSDTPLGDYTVNVNISFNDPDGIKMYEEHDLDIRVKGIVPPETNDNKKPTLWLYLLIIAIIAFLGIMGGRYYLKKKRKKIYIPKRKIFRRKPYVPKRTKFRRKP